MLGYVASCLGLSPTPRRSNESDQVLLPSPSVSPQARPPKKPRSAVEVSAAAAAASFAAATADCNRVAPVGSNDSVVLTKSSRRLRSRGRQSLVKVAPTRVFISRRSAYRSEYFINLSGKRRGKSAVCLSEGDLPIGLSSFECQLSVVRRGRRYRSETMNQKSNGCDLPRSRNSTRHRSSRSPGCYTCDADALASLTAAGWTCTTTETQLPEQVQYLYHMPYLSPVHQSYQQYPVEMESQYIEVAQTASPTFIAYSSSSPQQPNLRMASPRNMIACQQYTECPPCPPCPLPRVLSPTRTRRSPPKPNPYDRGLCEGAEMSSPESVSPGYGRTTKKTNVHYYAIPFEDVNPHLPPQMSEDDDDEDEARWKGYRRHRCRERKDLGSPETGKYNDNSTWNRIPMTNESEDTYSSNRISPSETTSRSSYKSPSFVPSGRKSPLAETSKSSSRSPSVIPSARKSQPDRQGRNIEMATQTSSASSSEFLIIDAPTTVATQTSLQVLVINKRKDQAGGDIDKKPSNQEMEKNERNLSPIMSPRSFSVIESTKNLSPITSRLPSPEVSLRTSPGVRESSTVINAFPSQEISELVPFQEDEREEGSRGNLEAGRDKDTSPTISFSTGSGSTHDHYVTPPMISFDECPESPGILGELSTELQALAMRVAVLEQKRSAGNSGTFLPEVVGQAIIGDVIIGGEDLESRPIWLETITETKHGLKDEEEEEEEEEEDNDEEDLMEDYPEVETGSNLNFENTPRRIQRHVCSFSDINETDWTTSDYQVSDCTSGMGSTPVSEARLISSSPTTKESSNGWCGANLGAARSSPNLHSTVRPSTRTPTLSTSNEEYIPGHEPEVVRLRTGGMVAVQALPILPSLGLGNSHWKKPIVDVGVGDWDYVATPWSVGLTGPVGESKNIQMSKEGGEGGENYHVVPPPPPPTPLGSPVLTIGDGNNVELPDSIETEGDLPFKKNELKELIDDKEDVDDSEELHVDEEEQHVDEEEQVEKVVEEEEKYFDGSSRDRNSTPFLLDSVLFPPMKSSPAGTPLIPTIENLRKRCNIVAKDEVEKTSCSTQTMMKASLDSDQLQLFSAFQRVVTLGESKLDEGLGLVDTVAIEIDLCRLEAITHIAYVVVVVCLFLLLTALLSFIVN